MNPIKVAPSRSVIFLIATLISIVIPVILRFKDIVR